MDDMTLDLTPRGAASIEALVNGPIQTNSYAVISNDECLIVDPAWEGERLVEHIRTACPEVRTRLCLHARSCRPCWRGRRGSSCCWRRRTI